MKVSFIPGELHLTREDGLYVVRVKGEEIVRSKSARRALTVFNDLRKEMQALFPERELTADESKALLQKAMSDFLVGPNSVRKRKRTTARSTRTFG